MEELQLVEYSKELETHISDLENSNTQGKWIRIKIHKDTFLQRARVFKNFIAFFAEKENEFVGSGVIAETSLEINGTHVHSAFGFDVKVSQSHRGEGIGKWLSKKAVWLAKKRFQCENAFVTLKVSNFAVQKIVQYHSGGNFLYPFVYLTVPSSSRLKKQKIGKPIRFRTTVNEKDNVAPQLLNYLDQNLGYFRTYLMYTLSIEKINRFMNVGYEILRKFGPDKFKYLPIQGKVFKTCTAFGLESGNLSRVNDILEQLEKEGVDYLMICCQRGDEIYNSVKPIAIDETRYVLGANFPLKKEDDIKIDVRCC